ncbi:hypothetical protein GCM10010510_49450 [Streptomyces anandii JCM 4720]|nr:hypothetical protein GCM10010510_49450 [Streptomyces anandii JCM 4720]
MPGLPLRCFAYVQQDGGAVAGLLMGLVEGRRPAASSREAAIAARIPPAQCTHTTPPGTSPMRPCSSWTGMWTDPSM